VLRLSWRNVLYKRGLYFELSDLLRVLMRLLRCGELQHCRHGNDVCLHKMHARHLPGLYRTNGLQHL